jgi:hypothetical protein
MNQKLITVMPTYKRPEMLALSLEKLSQVPQANSLDVRIYLDHTTDDRLGEVEYARDEYFPTAEIYRAYNHVLLPSGVWNILHALRSGYESGADLIFMVEEDIFVRSEFIERHVEMQASGDFFVTCGRQLPNLPLDYYSNPGTCYRREKLGLVVPHINEKYFADPRGYLNRNFGVMDDAGILDDGLIRRVMRSTGGVAKCAVPAIAFHQGFHYYDKMAQYKTSGPIQDRIAQLRVILEKVSPDDRYTHDFEPFLP